MKILGVCMCLCVCVCASVVASVCQYVRLNYSEHDCTYEWN